MRRPLALLLLLLAPPAQSGEALVAPSGLHLWAYEALWEDHLDEGAAGETWLVLRFLAPEIARNLGKYKFADISGDIDHICQFVGLPLAASTGGGVDQIIVNFLDRPLPRGQRDPETTQFMGAYRLQDGACIWE